MKLSRRSWLVIVLGLLVVGGLAWTGVLKVSYGVALTSRSMSHADVDLPGVLDPGERVSVAPGGGPDDVRTYGEGRAEGHRVGDDWGDVLSFRAQYRGRDAGVGIVHRAMLWVEYDEASDAYDVPELGLQDVRAFVMPEVGTWDPPSGRYVHVPMDVLLDPETAGRHDGWLTKGDHNVGFDQDARGALGDLGGPIELVESHHVKGRVTDFLEGSESVRMFWIALGVALPVALVVAFFRPQLRALGGRLRRPGAGCRGCGAALDPSVPFCAACGRQR